MGGLSVAVQERLETAAIDLCNWALVVVEVALLGATSSLL